MIRIGVNLVYSIKIFFKYFKFCVRKKPFYVYSYRLYQESIPSLIAAFTYPNKFYQITFENGKKGIACFAKGFRYQTYRIYKSDKYDRKYKWNFIGYENQKLIRDCSFKEFKNIYAALFYPHLASEEDIFGSYIADKLCSNQDDVCNGFFITKI